MPEWVTNNPPTWFDLSPQPTNLNVEFAGRTVIFNGDFKAGSQYSLKVHPDFHAVEPFKISGETGFSLEIPHIAPRLYFPAFSRDQLAGGNRAFPLLAINVSKLHLRAKVLDPQTAIYALHGYASYFIDWNERMEGDQSQEMYRPLNYNLLAGHTVFNEDVELNADSDTCTNINLKWDELLHGRKTGVVFLVAERASDPSDRRTRLGTQALIQLTDLGMVWKQSESGVDVFVFSQSSGRAVGGAMARLFSDENAALREVITDTNGFAHLQAATNAQWIAVQNRDDFHAMVLKEDRVWLNHFDIPFTDRSEDRETLRVLLFSDRHLYRPGEPLHLFGLVREWGDEGLSIPAGLTGTIDCLDRKGKSFFHTNAGFAASGGFSLSVPLPATLHGECCARLRIGTNDYDHSISVQDFQPDAFQVSMQCTNSFAAADKVAVPVSARYFFGKPLSRAKVNWSLEASDSEYRPERFGAYQFHRSGPVFGYRRSASSISLNGGGVLTDSTNFVITPDLPVNTVAPQPRTAWLRVEVTDLNQQTISDSVSFLHHSSDFYIGLRQASAVLTNGESVPLEILAVGADGKPWPKDVKAHLTLQRVDWQTVRIPRRRQIGALSQRSHAHKCI